MALSILFWSVGLDTRWRHCSGELKRLPRWCRWHYLQVLSGRSEELGSTKRNPRVRCMVIDACICVIFVCNAIEKIICSLSVAMLKFILDLTDQLSLLMWLYGYTNSQLTCHILVCLSLMTRRVTPEWILTTLVTCVTQMTIDVYGPLEYWMWMMKTYVLIFLIVHLLCFCPECYLASQNIFWSHFALTGWLLWEPSSGGYWRTSYLESCVPRVIKLFTMVAEISHIVAN